MPKILVRTLRISLQIVVALMPGGILVLIVYHLREYRQKRKKFRQRNEEQPQQ